jgi:hypothetical protein
VAAEIRSVEPKTLGGTIHDIGDSTIRKPLVGDAPRF